MGFMKTPAKVVVTEVRGSGVDVEAYDSMRAVVEHLIGGRRLYGPAYDAEELALWLEAVSRTALTEAQRLRTEDDQETSDASDA